MLTVLQYTEYRIWGKLKYNKIHLYKLVLSVLFTLRRRKVVYDTWTGASTTPLGVFRYSQ